MKRGFRLISYLLSAVILFNTCAYCFNMHVNAAEAGILSSTAEMAMALYSMLESAAVAGGVKDGFKDYTSGKSFYDSFISAVKSTVDLPDYGSFYLEDGTEVKINDAINNMDMSFNEDIYNTIIAKGSYTALKGFTVSAAFVKVASDYLSSIYAGEVEDVDSSDYIGQSYFWNGSYTYYSGSTDRILLNGNIWNTKYSYSLGDDSFYDRYYPCGYIVSDDSGVYSLYFLNKNASYGYVQGTSFFCSVYDLSTTVSSYSRCNGIELEDINSFNLNFPVFNSYDNASSYITSCGDSVVGLLNGAFYDFPALAESVPEVLAPVTDTYIDSSDINVIRDAATVAAASVATTGAIADNTADYILALTSAISALTLTAGDVDAEVKEWSDVVLGLPDYLKNIISSLSDTSSRLISWDDVVLGLPSSLANILSGIDDVNSKLIDWNDILTGLPEFPSVIVNGLSDALPGILSGSLADIRNGVIALPDSLSDIKAAALALPAAIAEELSKPLADILEKLGAITDSIADAKDDTKEEDKKDDELSSGSSGVSWSLDSLVYGLFLIILILIQLLKIFLHCLKFIICIFRIPASHGFLPDYMVMGFDYLRTLEITGIGISVFDFMMGLIHIMIIFGIIRLLRVTVDKIHLPHTT